jgi:branched-chain amino acid transport system permease protein
MRRVPTLLPLLLLLLAALVPFTLGTGIVTALLVQVFAFGAFAMSYDLLIGYTGIISFGHAMFFGTGAYAVAICLTRGAGSTMSLLEGLVIGLVASALLSLLVAFCPCE